MPQTLVTVEEAGRALGVSRSTVWRLIQRGELPSAPRGRRLVPASALRKRVAQGSATARPAFSEDHPVFDSLERAAAAAGRQALETSTPSSTNDPRRPPPALKLGRYPDQDWTLCDAVSFAVLRGPPHSYRVYVRPSLSTSMADRRPRTVVTRPSPSPAR